MFRIVRTAAKEYSCGAIVFTRIRGQVKYVIIENYSGSRGFPKGHVEGDETEEATALREVMEEVGLNVRLIPGFREEDEYLLPGPRAVRKHVTYFLAEYRDQEIVPADMELESACLMSFDEAMASIRFPNARKILRSADEFIRAHDSVLVRALSVRNHLGPLDAKHVRRRR